MKWRPAIVEAASDKRQASVDELRQRFAGFQKPGSMPSTSL